MRCCGGTGSCACKIEGGKNATVTGSGSVQDPYVVASDVALSVEDSTVFDLGLTGQGTLDSPWVLTVGYAATAGLNNIPDVNAPTPTNGWVLTWSNLEQRWIPGPPTTANAGTMTHDTSLFGDGSIGNPLGARPNETRYITTTASGIGLNDAGVNRLVRPFADAATRASASPAPTIGAISILNSVPGRLDYWDGSAWQPITNGIGLAIQTGQFLSLSGAYAGGQVIQYVAQFSATTDVNGLFDVIPPANLSGRAGVLSVMVQESGTTAWKCIVHAATDRVTGTAYRVDTGAPYGGVVLTGVVTALLY